MTLKSLEDFDREQAAKRARLEAEHKLAHALPTVGTVVEWMGENGWDNDYKPRDPIAKRVELFPYIIHGKTTYNAAEHVAFAAPDSLAGDRGEHVSSKYRPAFVRAYLRALLDVCAPHMLETVAVREPKSYCGYFPEGFDYRTKTGNNYPNATETARGLFVVDVSTHTGEHGFQSAELEFYISKPQPCKVSFRLERDGLFPGKLAPRARYISDAHNASVASWSFPTTSEAGAVECYKRSSGDRNSHGAAKGYTLEWLIPDRATLERVLGLDKE